MSIQIIPYSVAEFNKIPSLGVSNKQFHTKRGEDFVLGTLRPILLEHKMCDIFGVQLLHNHFELKEDEKLVDLNNQATGWKLDDDDKLMGGQVVPTSWVILKGQGLMPYEFEFKNLSADKGIDLTAQKYQPFLKDFVSAIETGSFEACIGLSARGESPGGLEITQGKSNIFFPTGTYDVKDGEQITAGWFFNPKPATFSSLIGKDDEVENRKCARFEGDLNHRAKQLDSLKQSGNSAVDSMHRYKPNSPFLPHYRKSGEADVTVDTIIEVQHRDCALPHARYAFEEFKNNPNVPVVVSRWCKPGHRPGVHYVGQDRTEEPQVIEEEGITKRVCSGHLIITEAEAHELTTRKTDEITKRVCSGHTITRPGVSVDGTTTQNQDEVIKRICSGNLIITEAEANKAIAQDPNEVTKCSTSEWCDTLRTAST